MDTPQKPLCNYRVSWILHYGPTECENYTLCQHIIYSFAGIFETRYLIILMAILDICRAVLVWTLCYPKYSCKQWFEIKCPDREAARSTRPPHCFEFTTIHTKLYL